MASALEELLGRVKALPKERRAQVAADAAAAVRGKLWVPNVGPQTAAYFSEADELLYGGEAGGGKSDVLLGLGLNEHKRSLILRRVNQDAAELGTRLVEIVGTSTGFTAHPPTWKGRGQRIELRGCEHEKDKQRFKGKPHDFYGYDELADFLESQYVFINTWLRSTDPNQRCRIVGATNGPTTAEGQWIVKRWGAWLDPTHPKYPTPDGVLRWYLAVAGGDVEVDGPGPHELLGRGLVRARSRTFIRSRLADNPDLARTDYAAQLESLPEDLRKVYRDGDFTLGMKDDDWQVIPTAWIEAAMQRWSPQPPKNVTMTAMAVDVAPGGGDQRVIGYRYDGWVGPLDARKQVDKNGRAVAADVVRLRRSSCPVVVDVGGGWGGDALIALKDNAIDCYAFNGVEKVPGRRTRDRKLGFFNKRAWAAWKLREELDPEQEGGSVVALPNDAELKGDLAALRWEPTVQGIKLEDKELTKTRIGRSPDKGDTVVMLIAEGSAAVVRQARSRGRGALPTFANRGYAHLKK